jgi:D-alanyl-lipoteichoic acid acyltransferase DltB (MBOAT superfamily)
MAWGFFQKFVIADRVGQYVNMVYGNPHSFHGLPLLAGSYFFAVQVYCDFAGYTDVAIGAAQILGFNLKPNFRRPFLADTLGEFWRRWHISLITWFRDYLYIPLGGNRVPKWRLYLNMLIVFTLSGLWHGAQWTFVIWGSLNGAMLIIGRVTLRARDWVRNSIFAGIGKIPAAAFGVLGAAALAAAALLATRKGRVAILVAAALFAALMAGLGFLRTRTELYGRMVAASKKLWMVVATFHLFVLGAVFFRARSVADAWYILTNFPGTNFMAVIKAFDVIQLVLMVIVILVISVVHYIEETRGSIRAMIRTRPAWVRWSLYFMLCSSIVLLGYRGAGQFIYFRF